MRTHGEKMMKTKTVCRSCGAEFDAALVLCPYCGAAYAPAEEEEYMDKLEEIREDLYREKEKGDIRIKKGMTSTLRAVILAVIVILMLIFSALWLADRQERSRTDRNKEEFLQDQGITTGQEDTGDDM